MASKQKEAPRDRPLTLLDFVRAKKLSGCPVCQLPVEVRGQLANAREKKISRGEVLEWLKNEVGAEITRSNLDAHVNGRHES